MMGFPPPKSAPPWRPRRRSSSWPAEKSTSTSPVHMALEPGKSVLLLMDFQNAIVGMVGDQGAALLERAVKAREAARKAGMAVMHVRVAFSDADYAAIPATNKGFSALAGRKFITDGTPPAEIDERLRPAPDEEVFTKKRVGAFSTTNLGARLKARGIDTLVLTGIATSGV